MQVISQAPFQLLAPLGNRTQSLARGHQWPKQDLIKYAVFLTYSFNLDNLSQEVDFASWSFFRRLSLFVQSKNPNQCRIFHKKMMKDHESINSLIVQLKLSTQKFQEWYSHYESTLHNMRNSIQREKDESDKVVIRETVVERMTKAASYLDTQEMRPYVDDDKKNEIMKPTDIGYDNEEPTMFKRASSFMPIKTERPSFSLFAMEDAQQDINGDLAMFARKGQTEPSMNFPCREVERQEKWRQCQGSFMDYMGKLSTLMIGSMLAD